MCKYPSQSEADAALLAAVPTARPPAGGNFGPSENPSKFPAMATSLVSCHAQIRQQKRASPRWKQLRFQFRFPKFPVSKPCMQKWKFPRIFYREIREPRTLSGENRI
jgi:hypothetical protein